MSKFYIVLYSTDTTPERAFLMHKYDSSESAESRYQSYINNMEDGGPVQAVSLQLITVDDDGNIQKIEKIKFVSRPTKKMTRYNQKKG